MYVCPLCPPERTSHLNLSLTDFLKHVKLLHSHQPGFNITCGINGCIRSFKNFRTFQDHISAFHRGPGIEDGDNRVVDNREDGDGEVDCDCEDSVFQASPEPQSVTAQLQRSSALFLLGLKEKHKLTQVALQGLIEGTTALVQCRQDVLRSQLLSILSSEDLPASATTRLTECLSDDGIFGRPFLGLETQHQQLNYYKTNLRLIEPVRVLLGERRQWKGRGSKRRCVIKRDEVMYIPLLDTLQSLLNNESILAEVKRGHKSTDSTLQDYCDGSVFQHHPLFATHPSALQILFYFDDVEVCNPLGSKTKTHKLSFFYFNLGNLSPKLRSKLSGIQLLAICKHKLVGEYGMDAVLQPMIEDLKKLENGYMFTVDGKRQLMYGALAAVSADNLGSLALGGFKESCSAYRCCRQCDATQETMTRQFSEDHFTLRDEDSHKEHCASLSSSDTASRDYGINRDSVLNSLRYFHVCSGALIPDIMHDVLEGALQYEIKLMLRFMIRNEEHFTLGQFNSRLESVELGYMETKDQATLITNQTLNSTSNSLKQSASQMLLLARVLPLIIGDSVPEDDERWQNYLRMMEIVDILFCPRVTEDDAAYLSILISDHHEQFCALYPENSIIPKMHFMIHMPRIMLQYGPLIHHWTMRYEAKHSYFKGLAQSMGNFINLPYSLSMRHQQYQCYVATNDQEIIGNGLTIGPESPVPTDLFDENVSCPVSSAYETKWLKINGKEYKKEVGIVYSMEQDLPKIFQIENLYVINGSTVVFKGHCHTTTYHPHFRIYSLNSLTGESFYVLYDQLPQSTPIHIRLSRVMPTKYVVTLPFKMDNFFP